MTMPKNITSSHHLLKAFIHLTDALRLPGVEDAEEQVPEDGGAQVLVMHLENGQHLLVTIAEMGESSK